LASARRSWRGYILARVAAGIAFNEHTDEDGATVFRHTPARWASKAYRSGLPRPTNPDRCGTGSRSGQSRGGVGAGALCETERMSRKVLPCNSRGNSAAMSRGGRNPLERRSIKRGRSRPCCGELRRRLIASTSWKRTITFSDPRRSLIAAIENAKELLDGRAIEVWDHTRVVARLDPDD
jgi:hypothetical protein